MKQDQAAHKFLINKVLSTDLIINTLLIANILTNIVARVTDLPGTKTEENTT